jgi:hypothetical protein
MALTIWKSALCPPDVSKIGPLANEPEFAVDEVVVLPVFSEALVPSMLVVETGIVTELVLGCDGRVSVTQATANTITKHDTIRAIIFFMIIKSPFKVHLDQTKRVLTFPELTDSPS